MVKLSDCGARSPGFDSWSRDLDFRERISSTASKSRYDQNSYSNVKILKRIQHKQDLKCNWPTLSLIFEPIAAIELTKSGKIHWVI